jgi:dethiobiotin synthetase
VDPAGLFVTGTGTEVGKTVVAAVIAAEASAAGLDCAVFKPAVSGLDEGGEPDHALLARASGSAQTEDEIAPYRYGPPLSPHLAAELAGEEIDTDRVERAAEAAAGGADAIVCEGVGGLMVPLRPDYLVRNLAVALGHPLVIAAAPGLGTINHTLLTIEAAWTAELEVRAVVLTPWPGEAGRLEQSNRETIAELTGVEVLTLERIDLAAPEAWPRLGLL